MQRNNRTRVILILAAASCLWGPLPAQANVLLSYDATDGTTPSDPPNNWNQSGYPMVNIGSNYLLQDWTDSIDPANNAGEYYSPVGALPAGTFKKGGPKYGIEFKVRPLNDLAFVGPAWAELYLSWTDDANHYNISIDQFSESNTSGLGDVVYGRGSFSKAASGIDWSSAHTIFIGHRPSGSTSIFDFYVDGVPKTTVVEGSIARDRTGWEAFTDRITFGDGTTGGAGSVDVGAEWYSVKVHDTNIPVVPASLWNVNGGGSFGNASNWTAGVPANLTPAGFGSIITSAATINMDSARVIGGMFFDNSNRYTIAGSGTLGFSFPGAATIELVSGSHTISAPVNFTSPLSVSVSAGNVLTVSASSITSGPGATMTKSGPGSLELTHLRGHRLQVDEGMVKILAGVNNSNTGASNVKDVIIAGGSSPTATLDLTNNAFVIDYTGSSQEATIREQIRSGFNAGDWQGFGITSSNAATASATSTRTGIAYAEAAEIFSSFPATFSGQSIGDQTTLLLKYTLVGDANLDEKVNTLDFNELAGGFGSGTVWTNGDFNYDGVVDSGDFSSMAANYGKTLPAAAPSLGAVVPEPAGLSLLVLASFMLRRKRDH